MPTTRCIRCSACYTLYTVHYTHFTDALYQEGIEHIKKAFLKTKARVLVSRFLVLALFLIYILTNAVFHFLRLESNHHISVGNQPPYIRWKFSAECGCWPQLQREDGKDEGSGLSWKSGRDLCDNVYPKSPTDYRWLNSGTWMGYVGTVHSPSYTLHLIHTSYSLQLLLTPLFPLHPFLYASLLITDVGDAIKLLDLVMDKAKVANTNDQVQYMLYTIR
jgi:hypothetical protein